MPSQYEEDSIIEKYLIDPKGYYVDVGAWHPVENSNTHKLYERGWTGVIIEPQDMVDLWKKHRPNDIIVKKAVSNKKGMSKLYVYGQVTSLEERWKIPKDNIELVETDTVDNIMSEFPLIRDKCDFLSIDVEGHEWAAINGINFDKLRPKLIVVEAIQYMGGKSLESEWETKLLNSGYSYLTSTHGNVNRFYIRGIY